MSFLLLLVELGVGIVELVQPDWNNMPVNILHGVNDIWFEGTGGGITIHKYLYSQEQGFIQFSRVVHFILLKFKRNFAA